MIKLQEQTQALSNYLRPLLVRRELNIETGWWYVDYIVESFSADELLEALRKEGEDRAFTKLIEKECNKDNQKVLIFIKKRWQELDSLDSERKHIAIDALDAHIEGRYALSVPAILPQVEHVYKEMFPVHKAFDLKNKTTMDEVLVEQYKNYQESIIAKEEVGELGWHYYLELYPIYHFLTNILFASDRLRSFQETHDSDLFALSKVGNRHRILHGEDASYATETVSLKKILLLDVLFLIREEVYHQ